MGSVLWRGATEAAPVTEISTNSAPTAILDTPPSQQKRIRGLLIEGVFGALSNTSLCREDLLGVYVPLAEAFPAAKPAALAWAKTDRELGLVLANADFEKLHALSLLLAPKNDVALWNGMRDWLLKGVPTDNLFRVNSLSRCYPTLRSYLQRPGGIPINWFAKEFGADIAMLSIFHYALPGDNVAGPLWYESLSADILEMYLGRFAPSADVLCETEFGHLSMTDETHALLRNPDPRALATVARVLCIRHSLPVKYLKWLVHDVLRDKWSKSNETKLELLVAETGTTSEEMLTWFARGDVWKSKTYRSFIEKKKLGLEFVLGLPWPAAAALLKKYAFSKQRRTSLQTCFVSVLGFPSRYRHSLVPSTKFSKDERKTLRLYLKTIYSQAATYTTDTVSRKRAARAIADAELRRPPKKKSKKV